MFEFKTSAAVLALLGVVYYESNSSSNLKAEFERQHQELEENFKNQVQDLQDQVRSLTSAQSMTHESLMLETDNRKEAIYAIQHPSDEDHARTVSDQIDLWEKNQWVVYFRSGYCQKISVKSKAEAVAEYNKISRNYAKIIWHNGKVVEKYGGNPWTLDCIQEAERSDDIHRLQTQEVGLSALSSKHAKQLNDQHHLIEENDKESDANQKRMAELRAQLASDQKVGGSDNKFDHVLTSEEVRNHKNILDIQKNVKHTQAELHASVAAATKRFEAQYSHLEKRINMLDAAEKRSEATDEVMHKNYYKAQAQQSNWNASVEDRLKSMQEREAGDKAWADYHIHHLNIEQKHEENWNAHVKKSLASQYSTEMKLQAHEDKTDANIDILNKNVAELQPGITRP